MKVLLYLNTILTNSLQNPEFAAVQTVTNRNERNIYLFEKEEKKEEESFIKIPNYTSINFLLTIVV